MTRTILFRLVLFAASEYCLKSFTYVFVWTLAYSVGMSKDDYQHILRVKLVVGNEQVCRNLQIALTAYIHKYTSMLYLRNLIGILELINAYMIYLYVTVPGKRVHVVQIMIFPYRCFSATTPKNNSRDKTQVFISKVSPTLCLYSR